MAALEGVSETFDPEAWDAIFTNFIQEVQFNDVTTSGAYVAMLNRNARYLGRLDESVTDLDQLFGFELAQAAGLHPVRVLASASDASVPAPGLPLGIGRAFPNGIASRYRLGPLLVVERDGGGRVSAEEDVDDAVLVGAVVVVVGETRLDHVVDGRDRDLLAVRLVHVQRVHVDPVAGDGLAALRPGRSDGREQ